MSWRRKLREAFGTLAEMAGEPVPAPPAVVSSGPVDALDTVAPPPRERTSRRAAAYRAPSDAALAGTELSAQLENLTGKALERASDILDIPLDPEDMDTYAHNLRGLNTALKTVLQTQVRVDEHRLKARKLDALPDILAAIAEEEAKRALAAKTVAA